MHARLLILAVGLPAAAACAAGPIVRCESGDGRVVYSNEPCPDGTRRTRTVNETPAVEVGKAGAEAHAADAKAAGSVRRTEAAARPEQSKEAASELRKLKLAECDDLVRRIDYAQRDLNAAAEGERASAELAVRGLQAEHSDKCGKRP